MAFPIPVDLTHEMLYDSFWESEFLRKGVSALTVSPPTPTNIRDVVPYQASYPPPPPRVHLPLDLQNILTQAGSSFERLSSDPEKASAFFSQLLSKDISIVDYAMHMFAKPRYETNISLTPNGSEPESFYQVVKKISTKFPNILRFESRNCRLSAFALLQTLTITSHIKSLTLESPDQITESDFKLILWPRTLERARFLNCKMSDDSVRSLLTACSKIVSLELLMCSGITLSSIALTASTVQQFTLNGCHITDAGIRKIREIFYNLHHLVISECPKVGTEGLTALPPLLKCLELHRLDKVDFSKVEPSPNLTILWLNDLDLAKEKLDDLMKKCRVLEKLHLVSCRGISSDDFSHLKYPQTLRHIQFYNMPLDLRGVNDLLLESHIETAEFSHCTDLPAELQQRPLKVMEINALLSRHWPITPTPAPKAASAECGEVFEMD